MKNILSVLVSGSLILSALIIGSASASSSITVTNLASQEVSITASTPDMAASSVYVISANAVASFEATFPLTLSAVLTSNGDRVLLNDEYDFVIGKKMTDSNVLVFIAP